MILLTIPFVLNAQERKKLETEKQDNLKKLKLTRELLDNTREQYKTGTNSINLLNRGIRYRESLIGNYEDDVNFIEYQISRKEEDIDINEDNLNSLKADYAKIVRASYKNIEEEYWLMFILSSSDINQGYQRLKYIRYLNDHRKRLYENILAMNDTLLMEVDSLNLLREEKKNTLENLENEREKLVLDKNQKSRMVNQLKSKEGQLLSEIQRREKIQAQIENEIRKIIEEEARRAREANRINALTPAEKLIDDEFGNNKGGLPWPVEQGIVTMEYGKQQHPVLSNIVIFNNGIDISTVQNSNVRAIFNGEVTKVVAIMGANYTVIIKHGNYRTIYHNLVDVRVKAGDKVETKEYIGKVGSNESSESKLHFELWDKMETRNPEIWLSK